MTDFLSSQSHVTASSLKIHQQAVKATKIFFSPISADGICLETRDPSGADCHLSDCPVWEPAQSNGLLSREEEEGEEPLPRSLV